MTPRSPSQVKLRRGEAATWGAHQEPWPKPVVARTATTAKIWRWQPYQNPAGTMRSYLDPQLPSGMIINGCKLLVGPNGKYRIAMPSQKAANKDGSPKLNSAGKQVWIQHIDFVDNATRNKFGNLILEALRREHPEAFDEGRHSRALRAPRRPAGPVPASSPMTDDRVDDLWPPERGAP